MMFQLKHNHVKLYVKKAICASLLLTLSSAALAQDWSGFYVGPQLSYNWVNTSWLFQEDSFYTYPGETNSFSTRPDGFTVGSHVGWVHQVKDWVIGIEASYDGGSFSDKSVGPLSSSYPEDEYNTKISQMMTVTPILGYAEDKWMYYVKGGYASAKLEISAVSGEPVAGVAMSDSQRQYGWTAGAGISYQLTEKHSLALEYDYTRLNDTNFTMTTTGDDISQEEVQVQPVNINAVALVYSYHFG